jgi:hypothetical protein
MDHRITVAIIAVFGGTLAFTFLVVSLTTTAGPDGSGLAFAATAEGDGQAAPAGPTVSPRDELVQLLQLLDRRTDQWKRDHGGRLPDFRAHPAWEQFLQTTGPDGRPQQGGTVQPYLTQPPVNPLNRLGFVYSTADGCYWGTNGSGRVILARGTEPAATPAIPPLSVPRPMVPPAAPPRNPAASGPAGPPVPTTAPTGN